MSQSHNLIFRVCKNDCFLCAFILRPRYGGLVENEMHKRHVACRMNSVPLITISNLFVFSNPKPDTHIHIQVPLETVEGDQIFKLQNFCDILLRLN